MEMDRSTEGLAVTCCVGLLILCVVICVLTHKTCSLIDRVSVLEEKVHGVEEAITAKTRSGQAAGED
jgi:hypothetical protein